MVRAALAAGQAAGTLVDTVGLHSPRVTAAVRGLVELLPWEPARRAALCALSCRAGALNRLLDLVRVCLATVKFGQWRRCSIFVWYHPVSGSDFLLFLSVTLPMGLWQSRADRQQDDTCIAQGIVAYAWWEEPMQIN